MSRRLSDHQLQDLLRQATELDARLIIAILRELIGHRTRERRWRATGRCGGLTRSTP